jgi:multiple antibiotic resistance protein
MQVSTDGGAVLGLGAVFTLMIVTLGPIKILGPFAQATHEDDPATARKIAFQAFLFSIAAVLISALAGLSLLNKWHISVPGLELAGGIIFLIIGLRIVLEQYQPPAPAVHATPPASTTAAALRLTFPTIITPYGIAAVMVLLARSHEAARTTSIVLVVVLVMVLNLLAMLGARKIMGGITLMILRIVGAVLGVLQVALAVEMILRSLADLGVLHG